MRARPIKATVLKLLFHSRPDGCHEFIVQREHLLGDNRPTEILRRPVAGFETQGAAKRVIAGEPGQRCADGAGIARGNQNTGLLIDHG